MSIVIEHGVQGGLDPRDMAAATEAAQKGMLVGAKLQAHQWERKFAELELSLEEERQRREQAEQQANVQQAEYELRKTETEAGKRPEGIHGGVWDESGQPVGSYAEGPLFQTLDPELRAHALRQQKVISRMDPDSGRRALEDLRVELGEAASQFDRNRVADRIEMLIHKGSWGETPDDHAAAMEDVVALRQGRMTPEEGRLVVAERMSEQSEKAGRLRAREASLGEFRQSIAMSHPDDREELERFISLYDLDEEMTVSEGRAGFAAIQSEQAGRRVQLEYQTKIDKARARARRHEMLLQNTVGLAGSFLQGKMEAGSNYVRYMRDRNAAREAQEAEFRQEAFKGWLTSGWDMPFSEWMATKVGYYGTQPDTGRGGDAGGGGAPPPPPSVNGGSAAHVAPDAELPTTEQVKKKPAIATLPPFKRKELYARLAEARSYQVPERVLRDIISRDFGVDPDSLTPEDVRAIMAIETPASYSSDKNPNQGVTPSIPPYKSGG